MSADDCRRLPDGISSWPACDAETLYEYGFVVWPDETSPRMKACPAVYELFRHIQTRSTMQFTERAFNDFRDRLATVGLTLREIERVPYLEPVGVL